MQDSSAAIQGASSNEPKYLREAKFLLQTIFTYFKNSPGQGSVHKQDVVNLIRSKHEAFRDGYMGFEEMLLDIVKDLDETTRESTGDSDFFDEFRLVVRCFERYDHAQSSMGMIAFTENTTLTEPMLRNFLKIKQEFDKLEPGLFNELFVEDILANDYISYYGKKKLVSIRSGLEDAFDRFTINKMLEDVKAIADEERLYHKAFRLLGRELKEKVSALDINTSIARLKGYITKLLSADGIEALPDELLGKILLDLRKELFYINNILPVVKDGFGLELREDFIKNSGLDKGHVEELDRMYLSDEDDGDDFEFEL